MLVTVILVTVPKALCGDVSLLPTSIFRYGRIDDVAKVIDQLVKLSSSTNEKSKLFQNKKENKMIVKVTTLEGVTCELKIVFRKTPPQKRRRCKSRQHPKGRELIDTTCEIFLESGPIACETAFQSALDSYNKIIGKKVALTKAISAIPFLQGDAGCNATRCRHRELLRRGIWLEFHKTFGKWS